MQLLGKQFVLLSALIVEIMAVVSSEEYLTVVMNVAPNLEHNSKSHYLAKSEDIEDNHYCSFLQACT